MSWGVMTVGHGGHFASDAEVADWPDVGHVELPASGIGRRTAGSG